jgi:RNA polymerase sigma factor (sigma-70 family)
VLNGQKAWATNGGIADVHVVIASVDRELGARGHAAFVVSKDETRGIEQGTKVSKHGLRAGQAYSAGSLDAHGPGGDDDPSLIERLSGADARLAWAEGRTLLHQSRVRLDQRERLVFSLRFDADLTQLEIAERIGCSQMQVSRVLRGALRKVREAASAAA